MKWLASEAATDRRDPVWIQKIAIKNEANSLADRAATLLRFAGLPDADGRVGGIGEGVAEGASLADSPLRCHQRMQ